MRRFTLAFLAILTGLSEHGFHAMGHAEECGLVDGCCTEFEDDSTTADVDRDANSTMCKEQALAFDNHQTVISEASYEVPPPAPKAKSENDDFGVDMGIPQTIEGDQAALILSNMLQAREYMENVVMVNETYAKVRDLCRNKHELCSFWSSIGECSNNPAYMHTNCGPACQTCEVRNFSSLVTHGGHIFGTL